MLNHINNIVYPRKEQFVKKWKSLNEYFWRYKIIF